MATGSDLTVTGMIRMGYSESHAVAFLERLSAPQRPARRPLILRTVTVPPAASTAPPGIIRQPPSNGTRDPDAGPIPAPSGPEPTPAQVRKWCQSHNVPVSVTGRISASALRSYQEGMRAPAVRFRPPAG